MKNLSILSIFLSLAVFIVSCGGETKTSENLTEETTSVPEENVAADFDLQVSIKAGEALYSGKGLCATCHQANGLGIEKTFPPLSGADFLLADKTRAIKTTMYGSKQSITVNGVAYPGGMMTPATSLSDEEIRDLVNYVLNSWGNNGGSVTTAEVTAQR